MQSTSRIFILSLGLMAGFLQVALASEDPSVSRQDRAAVTSPPKAIKMSKRNKAAIIKDYEGFIAETTPLKIGDPEEDVLVRMGKPEGVLTVGAKKRLSYGKGYVTVSNGRVIGIKDIPHARLAAPDLDTFEDYQEALGKVRYMGKWMTEAESQEVYAKTLEARERKNIRVNSGKTQKATRQHKMAMAKASLVDFKQGGKRINKQDLLAPGKVTVVDFYADWCGPCKTIAPYLETFSQDPQVAIRKVDIINWNSPVAKQWKLRSIPNMRVYGPKGNEIGKPTSNLQEVYKYIQQAKRGL